MQLQAQNCTNISQKQWTEVQSYVNSLVPIIIYKLYPPPPFDNERLARLDSLKNHDYSSYVKLINGVNSFIKKTTEDQQTCFYAIANNNSVLEWIGFLYRQKAPKNKTLSPEFKRGFGILAELNQGALNPFQDNEAYLMTIKALPGYTFAKESSGGHIRLFLGPTMYYSGRDTQFLLTSRAEIRLKDIVADPVSLGTFKLIGEASTNIDGLWTFGPGAGIELPNFGIQLLHLWHNDEINNHMEIGISYRFLN